MTAIRLPLVETLESRDETANKDELPLNCFVDVQSDRKYVTKRFGMARYATLPASEGQHLFRLRSDNFAIAGDVLYRLSDAHPFTYPAPNPLNAAYQSVTQPDNLKTIFKTTNSAYVFDEATVAHVANGGGVSGGSIQFAGSGGAIGTYSLGITGGGGNGATGVFDVTGEKRISFSMIPWGVYSPTSATARGGVTTVVGMWEVPGWDNVTWTTDGVTWGSGVIAGITAYWRLVISSQTSPLMRLAFAYGQSGEFIGARSSDGGVTWTRLAGDPFNRVSPGEYVTGLCACASPTTGRIVVLWTKISGGVEHIYSSVSTDNGYTFFSYSADVPFTADGSHILGDMVNDGSKFLYVGTRNLPTTPRSTVYTTSDGVSWTGSVDLSSSIFRTVARVSPSPAIVLVPRGWGSTMGAVSYDGGASWLDTFLPASYGYEGVAWNGVFFCAVSAYGGEMATSLDGQTWTRGASASTGAWGCIAADSGTLGGKFVSAGNNVLGMQIGSLPTTGGVTAIRVTNAGSGYTSAPALSFSACPGLVGAAATTNVSGYPAVTVPGIAYLDGTYYVMASDGTNRIFHSFLGDPTQWYPTYAVAQSVAGDAVAIARHLNYIVAFKTESIEFMYDAGNPVPGSPLSPVMNSVSRVGCAAAGSIVSVGDPLVFMSKTKQRGMQVSILSGTVPTSISTSSVDRLLNSPNSTGADVYAFAITIHGHTFYVLTLKQVALTLAFDMTTKTWARWTFSVVAANKSITSLTYSNGMATAVCAAHGYSDGDPVVVSGASAAPYNVSANITYLTANSFSYPVGGSPISPSGGTPVVHGWEEGAFPVTQYLNGGAYDLLLHETEGEVYYASTTLYQDDGAPINTKVRTPIFDGGNTDRKRISAAELVGNKVAATTQLRYSDDDYNTWSTYRPVDMNASRSRLMRLGSSRRRSFELRHTDNTTFRVEALQLDVDDGEQQ